MSEKNHAPITVSALVNAPVQKAWEFWTTPEHIVNWNFASDDWCCPSASCHLTPGGTFSWRMEAKNGSMGFDFSGKFDTVSPPEKLTYMLEDGRQVAVEFKEQGSATLIEETFEPENENSPDLQQEGWQAILNNFKKFAESKAD